MKIKPLLFLWFFLSLAITAQSMVDEFQLVSNQGNELILSFQLPDYALEEYSSAEGTFTRILAPGAALTLQSAEPEIPYFTTSLMIPEEGNVEVEVIQSTSESLPLDFPIIPSKGNLMRDVDPSTVPLVMGEPYQGNMPYPAKMTVAGDRYRIRSTTGHSVHVFPFIYFPENGELKVTTSMLLRVKIDGETSIVGPEVAEPRTFQNLYRRNYINYPSSKSYDPLDEDGCMLILCHDEWVDEMQGFANWKNQRGLPTEIVPVSEAGTTSEEIKDFVMDYYGENELAYLLLVGDDIHIPPVTSGVAGDSDNGYAYLVGDDHYPDIFVGRFSAMTTNDVLTQVQRTLDYEMGMLEDFDWLDRSMGIASQQGPGDDNEYDYQHVRNLQNQLVTSTYETPYYEFYDGSHGGYDATGNPTSQMVISGIDSGAGLIWYCGHGETISWTTSNFDNTDVMELSNFQKLPIIISTACLVGNFTGSDSACFAEVWMRARKEGLPIGSVANFMSSITQPWNPPMEAQDEMAYILSATYPDNRKYTFGGLVINGCFSMNEAYGSDGYDVTDTWILFGDPSLLIRTDVPAELAVDHPDYILEGTSSLEVECDTEEMEVYVSMAGELLGSATVSGGSASIPLESIPAGTVLVVTVNGHNVIPYIGEILVTTEEPFIILNSFVIDEEEALVYGQDQQIDLTLQNIGISDAQNVMVDLTTEDPSILAISSNTGIGFGPIPGEGGMATNSGSFLVAVSAEVTNLYEALFMLHITEGNQEWTYEFLVPVWAPSLEFQSAGILDATASPVFISNPITYVQQNTPYYYEIKVEQPQGNGDSNFDPGENLQCNYHLKNKGNASVEDLVVEVSSSSPYVTLVNSQSVIDHIEPGDEAVAVFEVEIAPDCPPGEIIGMEAEALAGYYTCIKDYSHLVGKVDDRFESADFNTLEWDFPGDEWIITNTGVNNSYAALSYPIDNSQQTEMSVTADILIEDSVSFSYNVSSEAGCDEFSFRIDGEQLCIFSGETGWQKVTFPVSAGTHTFTWQYEKDFIFSSGEDRVLIDDVSLPPYLNERCDIRIEPTELPSWLSLEDQYTGQAILAGTAQAATGFDDVDIQVLQNDLTNHQQFTIETGTVNIFNNDMKEIDVSPNPFSESVTIDAGRDEGFTLVVSNMKGKVIYLRTFPENKSNVNLHDLPPGVYIFKIIAGGNSFERKIIKK